MWATRGDVHYDTSEQLVIGTAAADEMLLAIDGLTEGEPVIDPVLLFKQSNGAMNSNIRLHDYTGYTDETGDNYINPFLNTEGLYESFKGVDGKFTLKLIYPELPGYELIWKQSSRPSEGAVVGFEIDTTQPSYNGNHSSFSGLRLASSTAAYIRGGGLKSTSYWWAVGMISLFNGKITGPYPTPVNHVELYLIPN